LGRIGWGIAAGCFIRLMSMQIVNGEAYQELIDQGYSTTYPVTAARGEIVDRYGRTLAANRVSHNITFDKNTMPEDETNSIILQLCSILSGAGEKWNDSLPLSGTAPFSFTGSDSSVSRLKKMLDQLPEFATADDAVYWLRERYDLQEYSDADFRA
jgi:penicillin-binding protein 2